MDFSGLLFVVQTLVVGFLVGLGFAVQAIAGIWIDSAWLWAFPAVGLVAGLLAARWLN